MKTDITTSRRADDTASAPQSERHSFLGWTAAALTAAVVALCLLAGCTDLTLSTEEQAQAELCKEHQVPGRGGKPASYAYLSLSTAPDGGNECVYTHVDCAEGQHGLRRHGPQCLLAVSALDTLPAG